MSNDSDFSLWCSIIIPTLNEETTLANCLTALQPALLRAKIEIIIADGGSQDNTLKIARDHGLSPLLCTCGRAQQMNAGARQAQGKFLWFLHADTRPPADWLEQLRAAAKTESSACFRLRFDRQKESWWLRLFARGSHLNVAAFRFGDQSLFVAHKQFVALGGYNEKHLLLEGHELVCRLRRAGNFRVLPAAVTTSARRYFRHGIVYTQLIFTGLLCAYYLGFSQARLWAWHQRAFAQET